MKGYIGVTSFSWWNYIKEKNIKRVNFWNTMKNFKVLEKGDVFFFLKKNEAFEDGERKVVGCALFDQFERMSAQKAWEIFENGNGYETFEDFSTAFSELFKEDAIEEIGCICLTDYIAFPNPIYLSKLDIEFQNAIVSGKAIAVEEVNKIIINAGVNYWGYGKYYLGSINGLGSAERIANELKNRSQEYKDAGVISKDLYEINRAEEYETMLNLIVTSEKYVRFKEGRKKASPNSGLISDQALNRYLSYLNYMEGTTESVVRKNESKFSINLGVGRVQNVIAKNIFFRDKSFYEFIRSAKGKKYIDVYEYCDEYFDKKRDRKYFGQIITPINLLGLIETDENEVLIQNDFLEHIWKSQDARLAHYYMNYFLCMWQYPLPSTSKQSGRELKIFKPYCLLLKILLELKQINEKEAYLTSVDFEDIFLELQGDMPAIDEIDEVYANEIILNRISRRAKGIIQENGSLTYIINTLAESDLLTKDASDYNNAENFYIGLTVNKNVQDRAEFIIREYGQRIFEFSKTDASGKRDAMSMYCRYINNINEFEQWRSCYMNITRIEEFKNFCAEKGFSYSDDLIRRFVLSLEAKPFLLLTGISGSGKTKIAELWSRYLESKNEAEWKMIAVGSNWTDNKKLLGFNNVLLEEDKAFQTTELVELMKKAESSDKEFIIILDEMNLSRVEMYFADFLSALESLDHTIKLANNETVIWSNNVKIIGTVNVDESTYMFSPKVLDRANVIEMNGISPRAYIESVKESDDKIYKSIKDKDWYDNYVSLLESVYTDLNGEFAYRVIDEITAYIALNVKLYGSDKYLTFVDEQVSQKILPKLHGSKAQLKPKLDKLQATFADKACPLVNDKLSKMQEDVKKGYTSFIGD